MDKLFFDDWQGLQRALIITVLAYITLVIFIRVSGKRTLAKMNAFDFIVTIALGSCLAAVSLNKSIALAEGAVVFFTLIFLQFVITWLSVRVKAVRKIVSGEPVMLLYQGKFLKETMKKERITAAEIFIAARAKGLSSLADIAVVVLETTGDITIVGQINPQDTKMNALEDVINPTTRS